MVAGYWLNNDGLSLQYGTQKAIPEIGGDFLTYGENREVEVYLNLAANTQNGLPGLLQTTSLSFAAGGTAAQAGIISGTTIMPLNNNGTAIPTTGSTPVYPIIYLEQIEVVTLIPAIASGATSINLGLVTSQISATAGAPATWVQVAPNPGVQLLNAFVTASMGTVGQKVTLYPTGVIPAGTAANQGSWLALGNMPLTTTVSQAGTTTLANSAFLSAAAVGGTYTSGLLKIRIKYFTYGPIIN